MPLYEYLCDSCGHRFEKIQKFSDPLVTTCPKCGKENSVEQVLSAPAVQFKGSGWYVTDYAKKGSRQDSSGSSKMNASSSESKGSESKSSDSGNSDSKSESKSSESKSEGKSENKSEGKSSSNSSKKSSD